MRSRQTIEADDTNGLCKTRQTHARQGQITEPNDVTGWNLQLHVHICQLILQQAKEGSSGEEGWGRRGGGKG